MSDNLHFSEDIREGEKYQDFINHELCKRGINFCLNTSKDYQLREGESFGGLEIKFDRLNEKTGNVFIETCAESKDKTRMIPGGIYKDDNAWLYLIGNYSECWIFSKKQLRKIWETRREEYISSGAIIPKKMSYSEGFLITPKMLQNSCFVIKHIDFKEI